MKERKSINLVGSSSVSTAKSRPVKPKKRKKLGKKVRSRGRSAASKIGGRGRGRSSR
jgi:hypothetical protein|tara:strand:+ start:1533 stop:1703 length:171 start_codon:yes stop_codon:yes gene_type:complete